MKITDQHAHDILMAMSEAVENNPALDEAPIERISGFAVEFVVNEVARLSDEPTFDPNLFELATLILSDCGISENNQPLYDRVLGRLINARLPILAPTEQQILDATEKAGLWPNTVRTWLPAFHRYHAELAMMLNNANPIFQSEVFEKLMRENHPSFPLGKLPPRFDGEVLYASHGTQHMLNGYMLACRAEPVKRNWEEDYADGENQYENICCICGEHFFGHKRRPVCKNCVNTAQNEPNTVEFWRHRALKAESAFEGAMRMIGAENSQAFMGELVSCKSQVRQEPVGSKYIFQEHDDYVSFEDDTMHTATINIIENGETHWAAIAIHAKGKDQALARRDHVLCALQSQVFPLAAPNFDAIKDKRMSELTPPQQADAMEFWLRENIGWFVNEPRRHIEFLLARLDVARSLQPQQKSCDENYSYNGLQADLEASGNAGLTESELKDKFEAIVRSTEFGKQARINPLELTEKGEYFYAHTKLAHEVFLATIGLTTASKLVPDLLAALQLCKKIFDGKQSELNMSACEVADLCNTALAKAGVKS